MNDLFEFLKARNELSWLLKSCIFHYELEFIHPFSDGNGRMGRLWQQLLLMKEHSVFEFVSIEEIIKKNQSKYYESLSKSDQAGESTEFVTFSLKSILDALSAYESQTTFKKDTSASRLEFSKSVLGDKWFQRKDYLNIHKDISTATASRDLAFGLEEKLLEKEGTKNQMTYRLLIVERDLG